MIYHNNNAVKLRTYEHRATEVSKGGQHVQPCLGFRNS
jgi:hypothetical protein